MALCEKCHSEKHIDGQARLHGIAFDEHGNAVKGSNVFLVCGSPGSGKSTYISENKSERDLVVDLDYICAALNGNKVNIHFDNVSILSVALEVRNLLYNIIRKRSGKWNRAYVSNTNTNLGEIRAIANDLGADIVLIDTPLMECIHRIRNDPSRKNMTKVYERLAVEWHKNFNKSVKDAIAPHIG
jgi:predicted kinase